MDRTAQSTRRNFVKKLGAAAATPWLALSGSATAQQAEPAARMHKILCCNIRVALEDDEAQGVGWNTRRALCMEVIRAQRPDIICLQEVLREQDEDMRRSFPNYFSFGYAGPEMDVRKTGYHFIAKNVILFATERYTLISAGCYWLSETPHIGGSLSWGSARARHVNWIRLRDCTSGSEFRLLNIHLDHKAQGAREKQMEMAVRESAQYLDSFPQLLAGDFNVDATNPVIGMAKEGGWTDTYASVHGSDDPGFTYHAFRGHAFERKTLGKIDFIFGRGPVTTRSAEIIRDHRDTLYPSDHYFVSATVKIGD